MPFLNSLGSFKPGRGFSAAGTIPDAPTITSSTAGNGQLTIAFTAPSFNGGLAITKYQYSTDGTNWSDTDAGTTSPRVITGLANGTDYTIRLRAVNALGGGKTSNAYNDAAGLTTKPFTVPSKPATPTLSIGSGATTTDTFSWTAPSDNGRSITKYGTQTSTDGGVTWSAETETTTLSRAIETAYTTSSYKLRVRAYNAAEWGPYSDISTSGTGAWSFGSMTDSGTCSSFSCSCGSCSCGSNTGTNSTATGTRTCYRWTRTGGNSQTQSSSLRNQTDTGACSTSYSSCTGGSCTECSGCTDPTTITTAGTYNGTYYTPIQDIGGSTWMTTGRGPCACSDYDCYTIVYCSVSQVYTITSQGCIQCDFICK